MALTRVRNNSLAFDGGTLANRNKIIGGDFTTNPWQRGTSVTNISTATYTADRWNMNIGGGGGGGGVVSNVKTIDSPTVSQAGIFSQHCLNTTVTTLVATIGTGKFAIIEQSIEGYNAASFGFGQAGSRFVTLSFWVKATKTGIRCIALRNGATNRSYVAEYTVNTTNTWEFKVITMPVDTSGTWAYDNTSGLQLAFSLATGTSLQTTATTWQTGAFLSTANQVNDLDTVGNTFKIALVQLEAGSTATPFETRSIGQEQSLCERYFRAIRMSMSVYALAGNGTGYGQTGITMRATPTVLNPVISSVSNSSAATISPVNSSITQFTMTVTAAGNGAASVDANLSAEL